MDRATEEGTAQATAILAIAFIAGLPIFTLVWPSFTLSHWAVGWVIPFLTLVALAAAAMIRELQFADAGAVTGKEDREPLSVALRDIAISLIGVMAGVSLPLLPMLLLR